MILNFGITSVLPLKFFINAIKSKFFYTLHFNLKVDNSKLIEAITRKKHEVVKKLIKGQVNQPLDGLLNKTASGPPLFLAIHNLDTVLVEILICQLRANVNQEIFIHGKKSTLLIYAIRCLAG